MLQRLQVKRNEKGFTLIELLIVIIVLGILAAIVVFAVGTTRDDAAKNACRTEQKSFQLAAESVKTKNGAYPAAEADLANPVIGGLLKDQDGVAGGSVSATMDYAQVGTGYTVTAAGTQAGACPVATG